MDDRTNLHERLVRVLGSRHAYFQPPPDVRLVYPCIVYKFNGVNVQHADDRSYRSNDRYIITIIDRNPDSSIRKRVEELPYIRFERAYSADNLYHWVYEISI